MADLLDGMKADLDKRIAEIEPLVAELERLKQARAALGDGSPAPGPARTRRSGATTKRRPRASAEEMEERRDRTLALIDGNKGITTANLARLMDLTYPNTTAMVRKLASEKAIKKSPGGGWETARAPK
jgi:hypothetical protein